MQYIPFFLYIPILTNAYQYLSILAHMTFEYIPIHTDTCNTVHAITYHNTYHVNSYQYIPQYIPPYIPIQTTKTETYQYSQITSLMFPTALVISVSVTSSTDSAIAPAKVCAHMANR